MKLQTGRLDLQVVSRGDIKAIHELHSLPQTDEFNTLGIPENFQTTEDLVSGWIEEGEAIPRTAYIFSIRLAETNTSIGLIGLQIGAARFKKGEVWYKLHPGFWRQGYAREALMRVLQFGFGELALHRVEAGCAVENRASIKLLESVGMVREGRKRQALPVRGSWLDNYLYGMLESDLRKDS